jgi:HlyD family secretion protein
MRTRSLRNLAIVTALVGLSNLCVYSVARTRGAPAPRVETPEAETIELAEGVSPSTSQVDVRPEVYGTITRVFVTPGQFVPRGAALLGVDDSSAKATNNWLGAQLGAACAPLDVNRVRSADNELRATCARVESTAASLRQANELLSERQARFSRHPEPINQYALESAIAAADVARSELTASVRRFTHATHAEERPGAKVRLRRVEELMNAYVSSTATLGKYTIEAPVDGVVVSIGVAFGDLASPEGVYDTYTQQYAPVAVVGASSSQGVGADGGVSLAWASPQM